MRFTGLFPALKSSFFPPYGSSNLERKPQTSRADSLFGMRGCFTANTYVKKGRRFHDFMSIYGGWMIYYGWNTYPTMDRCYLKRFGGEGDHRDRFLKMFQLVQEFKVQFEQSFPLLSPGLANSRCFCGAGFMVLSPARGHCVRMMCALARTEHFHRTSVVVERGMKRKAGGGERKHFSGSNKWRCRV